MQQLANVENEEVKVFFILKMLEASFVKYILCSTAGKTDRSIHARISALYTRETSKL